MSALPAKTPDVTPIQVRSTVVGAVALAAALGLPISQSSTDLIVQVVTVAYPIILIADAIIRHGRGKAIAAMALADLKGAATDPEVRQKLLDAAAAEGQKIAQAAAVPPPAGPSASVTEPAPATPPTAPGG